MFSKWDVEFPSGEIPVSKVTHNLITGTSLAFLLLTSFQDCSLPITVEQDKCLCFMHTLYAFLLYCFLIPFHLLCGH